MTSPDGDPTRWEFPEHHPSLPSDVQKSLDGPPLDWSSSLKYFAPECALDEQINTQSDIYSLRGTIYAKSSPPFRNHSSSSTLRSHLHSKMEGWDPDLQFTLLYSFAWLEYTLTRQLALIRLLFARYPASRSTPSTLSTNPFFNSLLISTLNFLERSRSTSVRITLF